MCVEIYLQNLLIEVSSFNSKLQKFHLLVSSNMNDFLKISSPHLQCNFHYCQYQILKLLSLDIQEPHCIVVILALWHPLNRNSHLVLECKGSLDSNIGRHVTDLAVLECTFSIFSIPDIVHPSQTTQVFSKTGIRKKSV